MGKRDVVRRLVRLAADEGAPYGERANAAIEACRRLANDEAFWSTVGREEHERPRERVRRVVGPWYLRAEDERKLVFLRWRPSFVTEGIVEGSVRPLVLDRSHVRHVEWLDDDGKRRAIGCCPGNAVAAYVDVAVNA